jgi:hypothetical protein
MSSHHQVIVIGGCTARIMVAAQVFSIKNPH